jgi:hypothetical protein
MLLYFKVCILFVIELAKNEMKQNKNDMTNDKIIPWLMSSMGNSSRTKALQE